MPALPVLRPREVIAILSALGFREAPAGLPQAFRPPRRPQHHRAASHPPYRPGTPRGGAGVRGNDTGSGPAARPASGPPCSQRLLAGENLPRGRADAGPPVPPQEGSPSPRRRCLSGRGGREGRHRHRRGDGAGRVPLARRPAGRRGACTADYDRTLRFMNARRDIPVLTSNPDARGDIPWRLVAGFAAR